MAEANVNDRASVERLYPREDFERDAGENSDAKATIQRGLRILSAIDARGTFKVERGSRHVGEGDPEGDALFLAPFLAQADAPLQQTDAYGGAEEKPSAATTSFAKGADYRAFIDSVLEAAQSAPFKPAVGRHEERLRGFRGG
jgi:hypothetical protein